MRSYVNENKNILISLSLSDGCGYTCRVLPRESDVGTATMRKYTEGFVLMGDWALKMGTSQGIHYLGIVLGLPSIGGCLCSDSHGAQKLVLTCGIQLCACKVLGYRV